MSDEEYRPQPVRPPVDETQPAEDQADPGADQEAPAEGPARWGTEAGTGIWLRTPDGGYAGSPGAATERVSGTEADDPRRDDARDAGRYEYAGSGSESGSAGVGGFPPGGSSSYGGYSRPNPSPRQVYRSASGMKIGVWGAPGSGKTTYLGALSFACAHANPRIGRWGIAPCDEGSKQMMDELIQRLVGGTYPEPNNPGQYQEFRWNLAGNIENSRYVRRKLFGRPVPEVSEFDIELVDASGEVFGTDPTVPESVRKTALDHLEASHGLLFLFDPITERYKPSVAQYAANVINRLLLRAQETGRRDGRFLPYHVAVCITKTDHPEFLRQARKAGLVFADSGGVERIPDAMAEDLFNAICDGRFWDRSEQDALSTAGAYFVRDQLRVNFRPGLIRYYAVSAVGHQASNLQGGQQRLHDPVKPFNVLEPLVELHMQLMGKA